MDFEKRCEWILCLVANPCLHLGLLCHLYYDIVFIVVTIIIILYIAFFLYLLVTELLIIPLFDNCEDEKI